MTAFIVHVATMSVQDISDQRLDETASSLSNRLNKCEQRAINIDESFWRKHAVIDSAASESWAETAAVEACLRLCLKIRS